MFDRQEAAVRKQEAMKESMERWKEEEEEEEELLEELDLEDEEGFLEKPSFSFTFVEKDFLPVELLLLLDPKLELRELLREEERVPQLDLPLLLRPPPRNPPWTRRTRASSVQHSMRDLISLTDHRKLEIQLCCSSECHM